MHIRGVAIGLAALAAGLSFQANAAVIPLVNADFETRAPGDGAYYPTHVFGLPGWTGSGGSGTGHWNPTGADFFDEAAHNAVGFAHGPSLQPVLSASVLGTVVPGHVWQANTRYVLSADIGRRRGDEIFSFGLGLIAGDFGAGSTLVARLDGDNSSIAEGRFGRVQLVFQTGSSGGAIGGPLGIAFAGTGGKGAAIDNVRLEAFALNAVPEPATWAMMIAGFGLVGAAARRRGQLQLVRA